MNKNRLGNKRRRGTVLRKHLSSKTGELEEVDRPVQVDTTVLLKFEMKDDEVSQEA